MIVLAEYELRGIEWIDVLIRVSVDDLTDVVDTAHPDGPVHEMWVPQSERERMVRPEARAGRHQKRIVIEEAGQRQHFIPQIRIVPAVVMPPGVRMLVLRIPAFPLHAVHA